MTQPERLKSETPLKWSTGTGTDVWALLTACKDGDLDSVQSLLQKDPSLVRCHFAYRKPLYFAVRENRIEVAKFLLARDEDICSTPLGWAAKFGQKPMVEFLLSRGAKPEDPNDPPWATPLAWARRRGHPEIAALLSPTESL